MRHLISAMLLVVGVTHLLPLTGVAGASQLRGPCAIRVDEAKLEILTRHRAVLFGLLGAFMVYAAFGPLQQHAGLLAGLASVVAADVVALGCLVVTPVAYLRHFDVAVGVGGLSLSFR